MAVTPKFVLAPAAVADPVPPNATVIGGVIPPHAPALL